MTNTFFEEEYADENVYYASGAVRDEAFHREMNRMIKAFETAYLFEYKEHTEIFQTLGKVKIPFATIFEHESGLKYAMLFNVTKKDGEKLNMVCNGATEEEAYNRMIRWVDTVAYYRQLKVPGAAFKSQPVPTLWIDQEHETFEKQIIRFLDENKNSKYLSDSV